MKSKIHSKEELDALKAEKLKELYLSLYSAGKVKTKSDFCSQLNVAPTFYTSIINGAKRVSDSLIYKIAEVFDYNMYEDIFSKENKPYGIGSMTVNIPGLELIEKRIEELSSEIKELKEKIKNVPQQA